MSRKRDAPEGGAAGRPRKSTKRARVYTAEDAELAKLYDNLADESNEKRLDAATSLIIKAQEWAQALPSRPEFLQTHRKVIVRLFKGLCSNRKAARMGFFTALVELLAIALASDPASRNSIDPSARDELISQVLAISEETSQKETGASKQEIRDYLLGRVAGLNAILCSRAVLVDKATDKSLEAIIGELCKLAKGKAWLEQECGLVILEHIKRTAANEVPYDSFAAPTLEALIENGFARTPAGIATWLEAMRLFPRAKLPKNVWPHQDPFHAKEIAVTFKILRKNAAAEDDTPGQNRQQGARQHKAHFAFDAILDLPRLREDSALAAKFWTEVFDLNFFALSASPERKAVGFQTFAEVIAKIDSGMLDMLFSENFTKSLMNQSSKKERMLHNAAKRTLDSICRRAKTDGAVILRGLVAGHGNMAFDKITGTKTVQQVLADTSEKEAEKIVKFFKAQSVQTSEVDDKTSRSTTNAIADHLLTIVRNRAIPQDEAAPPSWLQEALRILATYAYIDQPSISSDEATRKIYHSRLISALTHLSSRKSEDKHWSIYPFLPIKPIHKHRDSLLVLQQADEKIKDLILTALKTLRSSEPKNDTETATILNHLLAIALYQALSSDTDGITLLSEISTLRQDILAEEGDQEAIGAILDLVMDFSSRQSSTHRQLATQTFEAFCDQLQEEHLNIMFEVLEQKETVAGQQALFDLQADEGGDISNAEDSDSDGIHDADINNIEHDSDDSDVEMIDETAADSDVSSSSSNSDEEDSEDEDGEAAAGEEDSDPDIPDAELASFNAALSTLLHTNPTAASDDSASDSDMSDDAMLALEPALAQAFRAHASSSSSSGNTKKQQTKDARQNITAFKNRVLDLLDIFVRQRASSALCTVLICPLLECMRTTNVKQIADRCGGLLRVYFDFAKKGRGGKDASAAASSTDPPTASIKPTASTKTAASIKAKTSDSVKSRLHAHAQSGSSSAHLWTILRKIHTEALKFASKAHTGACSSASLFLARLIVDAASSPPPSAPNGDSHSSSAVNARQSTSKKPKSAKEAAANPGANESAASDAEAKEQPYQLALRDIDLLYAETNIRRRETQSGLPASFGAEWWAWSASYAPLKQT